MQLTDKITITNEDNMLLMARYPDNYFDLAIVDPPYGTIKIKNALNKKEYKNNEPEEDYFLELKRVSKNQIIFGVNYLSNFNLTGGRLIWNKLGKDIGRRNQAPTQSDAEIAYQSFNNLVKFFSYTWLGNVTGHNYQINAEEFKNRIHLSQKPVELYSFCLKKYAKQGDKILDTHLGSGSIAIACHDYGFELTACELDKEYFDKAIQRIKNHTNQQKLF